MHEERFHLRLLITCQGYTNRQPSQPPGHVLLLGVDDLDELGLQRSASDEESVDVGALGQFLAVGGSDGPAVLDASLVGYVFAHVLPQPIAELSVNLLGLRI